MLPSSAGDVAVQADRARGRRHATLFRRAAPLPTGPSSSPGHRARWSGLRPAGWGSLYGCCFSRCAADRPDPARRSGPCSGDAAAGPGDGNGSFPVPGPVVQFLRHMAQAGRVRPAGIPGRTDEGPAAEPDAVTARGSSAPRREPARGLDRRAGRALRIGERTLRVEDAWVAWPGSPEIRPPLHDGMERARLPDRSPLPMPRRSGAQAGLAEATLAGFGSSLGTSTAGMLEGRTIAGRPPARVPRARHRRCCVFPAPPGQRPGRTTACAAPIST